MLKLYNTLTRKLEEFKTVKDNIVRMYNCGPTVYSYVHIGNLRSFVFADLLKRYLKYKGYKVKQVMNITDVGHLTSDSDEGEDKLMVAAKKENKDPYEISKFYTEKFREDIEKLNFDKADYYPKATEHIKEMLKIIEVLMDKGYAYKAGPNVYYDTSKFKEYGKLSGMKVEELEAGKRVEVDHNKKHPSDFVLWFTKSKFKGHLMKWSSKFGEGYPGWHIECTAMSAKYLTSYFENGEFETFDIHTGGEDNKFPHHEAEIAQSEAAFGKKFVNYWLHVKHLIVEGKKMSKSLGNFYTLRDLEDKGYDPMAVRLLLISTHYRQQLNFTFAGLDAAGKNLEKVRDFMLRVDEMNGQDDAIEIVETARKNFEKAMDDDLNVSGALAVMFDFMTEVNKINVKDKEIVKGFVNDVLDVFGLKINFNREIDDSIKRMIEEREEARKRKDWETADKIRDELKQKGVVLEDTPAGVRWKLLK
ncbi:cysteine--tRNA ligase [Candidatus Woesearchaeota archaeon]|nr:MAG: cysteine--tRNA ligase [Candidatus Woesearchaeota archaeon]